MSATVMIVDDEPFMLRLVEASLKKGGLQTECFRDAESALTVAKLQPPSLFILDLVMPGMDGIAALRAIKQAPELAAVPVIMLTSKGHQLTEKDARESGAAVFLTKPFSPAELLGEAMRLLGAAL